MSNLPQGMAINAEVTPPIHGFKLAPSVINHTTDTYNIYTL